jgi:hypothetical protein
LRITVIASIRNQGMQPTSPLPHLANDHDYPE